MSKKNLLSGSIAVLAALIICKITAFLQEMIIASYLGATSTGDVFNAINGIQETIYPMLAVGISQIFLPAYKNTMVKKGQKDADSLANYAIVFFVGISVIVVILLIVFAPFVVSVVVPGFDQAQSELTAHLVRISSVSYIFTCCASVFASMLMAHEKFFISEIRGAFTHLPIIIAAIFFYKRFGLEALAISLIVGGVARLAILLPFVHKGYRFSLKNSPKWSTIKSLLVRFPSALVSSGIIQLNTLVDKIMASRLITGSISCLSYGSRLYMVFQELFANVIATSSYPKIIELIAQNKKRELSQLLNKIVSVIWFFTVPLTIGGILYSNHIVNIVFVRGAFTSEMGKIAAGVFIGYISVLAFSSLNGILNNVYFGFGDTKSPMLFNALNLLLNIVLNFVFVHFFAVAGLAIATALSSVICLVMRVVFLRKKISLSLVGLLKQALQILGASLVAVGISFAVIQLLHMKADIWICLIAAGISLVIYVAEMRLLKMPVYIEAMNFVKERIFRKKSKEN